MSGFVNLPQISGPKTVILSVDFRSGFGVKYRCINIDVPHTDPEAAPPSGPALIGNSGDPRRDERLRRPPLRGGGRCTSRHPPETGGLCLVRLHYIPFSLDCQEGK